MIEGVPQDLDDDEEEEQDHRRRRDRLVLPMPVRMVLVRGPLGRLTPISPTTFEAASVSEWKPSDRMLIAPLEYPKAIFATATPRLRKRTAIRN